MISEMFLGFDCQKKKKPNKKLPSPGPQSKPNKVKEVKSGNIGLVCSNATGEWEWGLPARKGEAEYVFIFPLVSLAIGYGSAYIFGSVAAKSTVMV